MSTIVAGICSSHATAMNTRLDRTQDVEGMESFMGAVRDARRIIEESGADVAVMLGSNHFLGVHLDMVPAFAIPVGEAEGAGEGETPTGPLNVDTEMTRALAWSLIERQFDIAISLRMTLDHGITILTQHITGDLPIAPIVVNSFTPPLPTFERCRALGSTLRELIESDGQDRRVAIVATGGISHQLDFVPRWWDTKSEDEEHMVSLMFPRDEAGDAEYDRVRGVVMKDAESRVNPEWDEKIIAMFAARDWDQILALSDDEIYELGGNGAHELRSWVIATAATEGTGLRLGYGPMHEWHTGMGVVNLMA